MGGLKVMVIWTGSPLAGPSPCVTLSGALLIPATTVFRTEKLGLSRLAWKISDPRPLSRVAVSISTSPGELTRVGTPVVLKVGGPEVRPTSESLGKMWYTSISTLLIFASDVPVGTSPTTVAVVMLVVSVKGKSSAVSVSSLPRLGGWDSAPSRPSGEPVLKEKGSAQPDVARNTAT